MERQNHQAEAGPGGMKVVLFRVGTERYGLPGSGVQEVLSDRDYSWAPGPGAFLPGWIQVRGDAVPVLDLQCLLGGPRTGRGRGLFVVAAARDYRWGIQADAIEDVADVAGDAIRPPEAVLPGPAGDLAAAEVCQGEAWIPLLDLDKLATKVIMSIPAPEIP